jgi:hypothetical protein
VTGPRRAEGKGKIHVECFIGHGSSV